MSAGDRFSVGERVWWADPDNGEASAMFTVAEDRGEIVLLRDSHGDVGTEALHHELTRACECVCNCDDVAAPDDQLCRACRAAYDAAEGYDR